MQDLHGKQNKGFLAPTVMRREDGARASMSEEEAPATGWAFIPNPYTLSPKTLHFSIDLIRQIQGSITEQGSGVLAMQAVFKTTRTLSETNNHRNI